MKSSKKNPIMRINTYEVYPKSGVAQTMMHQNMSSHYKRIYNAKPRIDTGPPFSHKPQSTPKCFPWKNKNLESYKLNLSRKNQTYFSVNTTTKCSKSNCGEQTVLTFKPEITKTNVDSKLRSLRVYHPPRRRLKFPSTITLSGIEEKSTPNVPLPDIPWIHTTSDELKSSPSKASSSDSAYTEEGEGVWSRGESRGMTPVSSRESVAKSEDLRYAKFVQGITEEILRNGVFTNKALKMIFHSHIEANKEYLNLKRMQEEVNKLQAELGIPKDEDDDICNGSYSTTIEKGQCNKMYEDKELLAALSQLNLSSVLKADIASTLCFYRPSVCRKSNIVPQSDDDSDEMGSEESRPPTPTGINWQTF